MLIQEKEMTETFRVMSQDLANRDEQRNKLVQSHQEECDGLQETIKEKEDEVKEWKDKLQALEDEIQKNMAFKKGSHEYDIMVKRLTK